MLGEGILQHSLISGGGGSLQSLARIPSGSLDEEIEEPHLPLPALIESEMDICAMTFLNLKKRECELLEIIEDSSECLLTTVKWTTILSIISCVMIQCALHLQVGHIIVHFDKKLMSEFETLHSSLRRCYVVLSLDPLSGFGTMRCITVGQFTGRIFTFPINLKFVLVASCSFKAHRFIEFDLSYNPTPNFYYPSLADCHMDMLVHRVRTETRAFQALQESELSRIPVQHLPTLSTSSLFDTRSTMMIASSATDAANAAKAAANATNFIANMRAFKFLFLIQEGAGDNGSPKYANFEKAFADPKASILKLDEVKSKIFNACMKDNHHHVLSLSIFTKFGAFCKGDFGSEKNYKDNMEVIHFQDLVLSNTSSVTVSSLPLQREMLNKHIVVAVQNLKLILQLISSASWTSAFRQFTDWACNTEESDNFSGPTSYKGKVRFYFARMVFASAMSTISVSYITDSLEETMVKVSESIASVFARYKDDIKSLSDLMIHSDRYYEDQESRSVDASLLLKTQKGVGKLSIDTSGPESPAKKLKSATEKKKDKKIAAVAAGGTSGGKANTTASTTTTLTAGKRFCIKHMGSILFPNNSKFGCKISPCSFKHCADIDEYVSFFGSKEALKEVNSGNIKVGSMGEVRTELIRIL